MLTAARTVVLKLRRENRGWALRMSLHEFRPPGAKFPFWIVRPSDRIGHEFDYCHCPWELRITALFGSVRFLPSSDMGEAEIQAQSPLLRICTSVKTTFGCHACESSCIDLDARSPSKIAWRKFLERSLAILREMGSKNGLTQAQGKLARLARLQREYEVAHSFLKESFELAKQWIPNARLHLTCCSSRPTWRTHKASMIARLGCSAK